MAIMQNFKVMESVFRMFLTPDGKHKQVVVTVIVAVAASSQQQ
jgi:hypothetical protein